jgi:hypothetical protein
MPGDIFISYARRDDQAAREVLGAKGLVTSLHDRLLAVFDELGTPRPSVFRDTQRIDKADQFEPRLGHALREAKLLVVVLSRNWLDSEWCRRELDTFVGHWQVRGEDDQRVRERVVLVRKHAIPPEGRPEWLKGQSGYDLLAIDPENREEIAFFDADLGRPRDERWFAVIRELAVILRKRAHESPLPSIEAASPKPPAVAQPSNGRTVFVAWSAADMKDSRDTLVEELARRGFRVVPDAAVDLPREGSRAQVVIDAALAEAEVSIHLLGDKLGFTPEDSAPIVRLQLERAVAQVAASGPEACPIRRLIWAPRVLPGAIDGSATRDPHAVLARHLALPEQVRPEEELRPGDKLDGDTLTKFVQFVLQHLGGLASPTTLRFPPVPEGAKVYVEHHELDAAMAEIVGDGLVRLGLEPVMPALEGDPAERLQIHRDALQNADAVLLCWAEAADVWVRASSIELRRWQDLGRAAAFACRSVVALPPQRPAKERLRKFPPRSDIDGVIDATAAAPVSPDTLDPLLRPLLGATT